MMEKRKGKALQTYVIVIDFEKVFDNVPRNNVWQKMRKLEKD